MDLPTYQKLTYAGALPYYLGVLLLALGIDTLPGQISVTSLITSYALAIISFMAGTVWTNALQSHHPNAWVLLLLSNGLVLLYWFCYLSQWHLLSGWIAQLCFAVLLLIDYQFLQQHQVDQNYFRTRMRVTGLVMLALLFYLLLI